MLLETACLVQYVVERLKASSSHVLSQDISIQNDVCKEHEATRLHSFIILYCSVACADCWCWPAQPDSFYAATLSLLHHCCAIPMLMSQQANQKDGLQCLQSYSNILHTPQQQHSSERVGLFSKQRIPCFYVIQMLFSSGVVILCYVHRVLASWCSNDVSKMPSSCVSLVALAMLWHIIYSSRRIFVVLFSELVSMKYY